MQKLIRAIPGAIWLLAGGLLALEMEDRVLGWHSFWWSLPTGLVLGLTWAIGEEVCGWARKRRAA